MNTAERNQPMGVLEVMARYQHGPAVDPDTGADRGSCCEHAWADGWNDCIRNLAEARAAAKEFRDAAVEFYAGIQAMAICQEHNAPAGIAQEINERAARACERFDAALLKFDGGPIVETEKAGAL